MSDCCGPIEAQFGKVEDFEKTMIAGHRALIAMLTGILPQVAGTSKEGDVRRKIAVHAACLKEMGVT